MCFYHEFRLFWKQKGGFGMIETALTLPLFLLIIFGMIEFGNMFLKRYQVRDVADAVADYLEANPNATFAELAPFMDKVGLGLKNIGSDEVNKISAKIKIQSDKNVLTEAEFNTLCGSTTQIWTNPWLADNTSENDGNPYYIHVCYPYTYDNITPLSKLSLDALPASQIIRGKAIGYLNTTFSSGNRNSPFKKIDQYALDSKHEETKKTVNADYCVISRMQSYTSGFNDADSVRCEIGRGDFNNTTGMTSWDLKSQAIDIDAGQNEARCEFLCFTFKDTNQPSGLPVGEKVAALPASNPPNDTITTREIPITVKYGYPPRTFLSLEQDMVSYTDKCKMILMHTWPMPILPPPPEGDISKVITGPLYGCPTNMVLTETWVNPPRNCTETSTGQTPPSCPMLMYGMCCPLVGVVPE